MIPQSQYRGKLPYNIYKQRFQDRQVNLQQELKKKIETVKKNIPTIPTEKTINDNITSAKELAKKKLKTELQKKTGLNMDKITKLVGDITGKSQTKEDERKKQTILTGISLNKALQPSHDDITVEERDRAKLSKAGKIAYQNDDDFQTAQDYMDNEGLGTIDKELSTKQALVVKRPNGNIELAFRGTIMTPRPDMEDISTNIAIAADSEGTSPQFIAAKETLNRAKLKYGNIDHISGYSRGGTLALTLAQRENIPSTTFNTYIGPRLARGNTNTNVKHNIIRTTEDPVSIGLAFTKNSNLENWVVKTIKTRAKYQSNIPVKNVYDSHRLDNFTELLPAAEQDAAEDTINKAIQNNSRKLYGTINIQKQQKLIDNDKSFSDNIWEFQSKGNVNTFTGDNDVGGNFENPVIRGGRHSPNSLEVQNWRTLGGKFSEAEASVLNQNHSSSLDRLPSMPPTKDISPTYHRDLLQKNFEEYDNLPANHPLKQTSQQPFTPQEVKKIAKMDTEETQTHNEKLVQEQADLQGLHEAVFEPKRQVIGISEFARAFNPTHLGIGYAIGAGTNEALSQIPGFDKQNRILQEGEAGTIGAGITSGFQTALGGVLRKVGKGALAETLGTSAVATAGSVALLPELVAGGAGYIAGEESGKLIGKGIKKLGGGQDLQDAGEDIGGGGVGGFAGGLAAFGTALAADAVFGTELGAFFGPEGALAGGAIGAGVGTIAFAGGEALKGIKKLAPIIESGASKAFKAFKDLF
tara:strand:+ start:422 stop:2677 length:2256 start_codon:yes stop_codon:yes gene_type:complete